MSSIDNRIVDMKFNSAQFESGVQKTLSLLDKLKQGLKLDGARKGLEDVSAAANNVKLDGLSSGISTAMEKMDALRVVGVGALLAIGKHAVDLGIKLARNLGDGMVQSAKEGFGEYELKMGSIQTIMAGTGASLDVVNEKLNALNEYSDKTIYSFADMTSNIGKFTNAGVDLDTAVAAIQGISNAAALSGANSNEASRAMYNFSQAISQGHVKLLDWKSIENANMATLEFKTQLLESAVAAGTLTKQGDNLYTTLEGTTVTAENFSSTLQDQWLTTEALTSTLSKYADETTDIGKRSFAAAQDIKTFSQMMDTIKEAKASGWAQSFEILIGDFNEAKALWTEVGGILSKMTEDSAKARNEQLKIWKDGGGRTAVVNGLRNAFDALMQVITPLKEAWAEVFPPTLGEKLLSLSKGFEQLTEKLKIGADGSARLKEVAVQVFSALKDGGKVLGAVAGYFWDTAMIALDLAKALFGIIAPIVEFIAGLTASEEKSASLEDRLSSLVEWFTSLRRDGIDPVIEFLNLFGDALDEALNGDPTKFGALFQKAMAPIIALGEKFRARWGGIVDWLNAQFTPAVDGMKGAWGRVLSAIQAVWSAIKPVGKGLSDLFKNIGKMISDFASGLSIEQILAGLNTGFLLAMVVAIKKFTKPVSQLKGGLTEIKDGIVDSLGQLTGTLKTMQNDIKANILIKIAAAIAILAAGILVLSLVDPDRLVSSTTALAVAAGILMGAMVVFSKIAGTSGIAKMPVIAASLIMLGLALLVVATAVKKLSSVPWDQLLVGLGATIVILAALVAATMILGKNSGKTMAAAAAMILMATAIGMLAGVVAIFGMMPLPILAQGLIAVAVALGLMAAAGFVIGQVGPQMLLGAIGLMAMAQALTMLLVPITVLGMMDLNVLGQGLGLVAVMLAGLVVAGLAIAAVGPGLLLGALGIMAMAAAINLLVAPIMILGALPMDVLIQGLLGLAGVMVVLVAAAIAMSLAGAGIAGMIGMAGAILLLSVSLAIISALGLEGIGVAILGLAGALAVLGLAAVLLGPLSPVIIALSAALAIFAVSTMVIAAAMVVFSLGLMLLVPALTMATLALIAFAEVAPQIAEAVPAFLAIGAGLIVFGLGAAVAGVGALALGTGLLLLGVALAIIAVSGVIGATALAAVVIAVADLVWHTPQLLIMAGAFTTLGAALVIMGAGLIVVAAGGIATAAALFMLITAGLPLPAIMTSLAASFEKLGAQSEGISNTAGSAKELGSSLKTIASAARGSAVGLNQMTNAFNRNVEAMTQFMNAASTTQTVVATAFMMLVMTMNTAATQIDASAEAMVTSMLNLSLGVALASVSTNEAAITLVNGLLSTLTTGMSGVASSMGPLGSAVGSAIIAGMVEGLQNGGGRVSTAARTVARQALNSAKSELGIRSPSREFAKIGMYADEGLARGLDKNSDVVMSASAGVGQSALDSMRDALKKAADVVDGTVDTQPVIRPVIDLDEVRSGVSALDGMMNGRRIDVGTSYSAAQVAYSGARDDLGATQTPAPNITKVFKYEQHNNSPKALSSGEIYRQTKNQLSTVKEDL